MPATPYVTPDILTNAPTGMTWSIIPQQGASEDQNLAELSNICRRASAEADAICNQPLRATVDTETEEGPDFRLVLLPNMWARMQLSRWPVLQVISAKVTPTLGTAYTWTDVPQPGIQVESPLLGELGTLSPGASAAGPTAILLAPGTISRAYGSRGYRVQAVYVNGWPHTELAAAAAQGATTLSVRDITGWAGVSGTVYDGGTTEDVTCAAVIPATPGALSGTGTLTLASPLQNAHAAGVLVTSMAEDVQQAVIYLAMAQALMRGSAAVTVPSYPGSYGGKPVGGAAEDLRQQARELLAPYARLL